MFKKFIPNPEYLFDLSGNFSYKDKYTFDSDPKNMSADIWIDNKLFTFSRIWLALICHYEVDLTLPNLLKIKFFECKSKVLGIRCKNLMVFDSKILFRDDYFLIPGFTRYAINKAGSVISKKSGKILSSKIGPYGYPYVNVYDSDKNEYRSVNTHILLARTFIYNNEPSRRYFVNHIDGNKLNLSLRNLEWVTSAENQKHAIGNGLRSDNHPCKVLNVFDKSIVIFSSIGSALKSMNVKFTNIRLQSRVNDQLIPVLVAGKYEIKLLSDNTDWYYNSEEKLKNKLKSIGPFEAIKISSGQKLEADTIKKLSYLTEVPKANIESALRDVRTISVDGFLFRKKSDKPWPSDYTERKSFSPRLIKITNMENNKEILFVSIRQALFYLSIDKKTLKNRLLTGKPYGIWKITEVKNIIEDSPISQ